jgi:hypothetical protein
MVKQHKKAQYGTMAVPGEKALSFLFEGITAIKKQLKPAKVENHKKRKAESLLSTETYLTYCGDKMKEYFFIPPYIYRSQISHHLNSRTIFNWQ